MLKSACYDLHISGEKSQFFFCVYKAVFTSQTLKQHDNLQKFQMECLWLPPYNWIERLLFQLLHLSIKNRSGGCRFDWIKCLLFKLLHLHIKGGFIPMSNRKITNKNVLFLPVSVHTLDDRVLSNCLASKTIQFR